jgi:hypothetical protein
MTTARIVNQSKTFILRFDIFFQPCVSTLSVRTLFVNFPR